MCTNIDYKATKAYKEALKSKGGKGHAWKVVRIDGPHWSPPYQINNSTCRTYRKIGTNTASGCLSKNSGWVSSGAFHCFLTRKLARNVARIQIKRNQTLWRRLDFSDHKYKVVKVVFDTKDLVCVGRQRAIDKKVWELPDGNDSICVTEFKFEKK